MDPFQGLLVHFLHKRCATQGVSRTKQTADTQISINFHKDVTMPLVRISLLQQTLVADVVAVSAAVHNALVATFNVPEADRFQSIHRHSPEELVCTPEFLGIQHSGHVVFVQISCSPGRSLDMKKALYAKIAGDIAASSSFKFEDVIINLLETSRENWSFGRGIAQYAL